MKELWSDFKISIACFMTDDSKALKSALKMIWPEVIQGFMKSVFLNFIAWRNSASTCKICS
jgi:hypothetical protein